MKDWFTWFFLAALFVAYMGGCIVGNDFGKDAATETKETRDYRRLELKCADMEARLATLERIKIEVELRDKTATWFVYNGKVQ